MQSNLGNTPDVYLPLIILPIQFNFFLQQQKRKKNILNINSQGWTEIQKINFSLVW